MVYINDDYRFIFIDNPKSGSTSITNALSQALGIKIPRGNAKEVHLTTAQIKELYPDKWGNYLKVSTYRDPFRRFCSYVNYGSHYFQKYSTIQEFVEHFQNNNGCVYCLPQSDFTDGCDFLIHLDNIQKDFDQFCEKISIQSVKVHIVNKKDTTRKFFNLEKTFYAELNSLSSASIEPRSGNNL
jgi:hypothetical protein